MVHRYTCPLRWGDMDAQAHLNNAAFVDYLQEARVHFLLTGPPVMRELLDTGVLVVQHQIEYLRPVGFSDRGLDIDLWVNSVGGSRFGSATTSSTATGWRSGRGPPVPFRSTWPATRCAG